MFRTFAPRRASWLAQSLGTQYRRFPVQAFSTVKPPLFEAPEGYKDEFEAKRRKHRKIFKVTKGSDFVDWVRFRAIGGIGGSGSASLARQANDPLGGPDGGDGGSGGHVKLTCSTQLSHLGGLRSVYRAGKGSNGAGDKLHGQAGSTVTIRVPPGTVVRDPGSGEVLAEMLEDGQELVIAKGGKGGFGNCRFASSANRAPKWANSGGEGEERLLDLELQSIADVGLVGFPNAGKSSFLTNISRASPKVASYAFTTLRPQIGVVQFDDEVVCKVADLPGILDGASEDRGLGHDFLRHIERTSVLVYVVDTAGVDGRTPSDDLTALLNEVELYNSELKHLPRLVLANKMDVGKAETRANFKELIAKFPNETIVPMSAAEKKNINVALNKIRDLLKERDAISEQGEAANAPE